METPDETGDRAISGKNLIASKRMKTLRKQGKNSSNDESSQSTAAEAILWWSQEEIRVTA